MLPRVIMHNEASLDGRMDWITPHMGLYYGLVSIWEEDATLAGADTILAADEVPKPTDEDAPAPEADPDGSRALLVIPDSRGRVRCWEGLMRWPYWRGFIALVSNATPREYLDYLERTGVETIVAGDDHVDLRAALAELAERHGVRTVRSDSGGTLNGVLLRQGLVDEVSVLVNPSLVGGTSPRSIYTAQDLEGPDGLVPLELMSARTLEDGVVWLRYRVVK